MKTSLRLALLTGLLLLQTRVDRVCAQSFNGDFEEGGYFDLSGWTWDCEDPEADAGYQSSWGIKKLTAVTGVPPEPCSGVTVMQHAIPDDIGATYLITGWAYVDDPNMSASIGFSYADGSGGVFHQGDYTNSTAWDYLSWSDNESFFQGFVPQASLDVSDGFNGFGYGHFDGLELTITLLSSGVSTIDASSVRASLSPDGARLALWLAGDAARSVRVCDALGRLESTWPLLDTKAADPLIIDVAALPAGLHLVMLDDGQRTCTVRFVKH